jgi:hypothetical protein
MAVMSRECIQHLHVRYSEIVRVSGDDDEIVNERGRCDQTVLNRHRFTGLAQFRLCRISAGSISCPFLETVVFMLSKITSYGS